MARTPHPVKLTDFALVALLIVASFFRFQLIKFYSKTKMRVAASRGARKPKIETNLNKVSPNISES